MFVYVVSQNDFPAAVYRSRKNAEAFIKRQAKQTISGRTIYWHIEKFELGD